MAVYIKIELIKVSDPRPRAVIGDGSVSLGELVFYRLKEKEKEFDNLPEWIIEHADVTIDYEKFQELSCQCEQVFPYDANLLAEVLYKWWEGQNNGITGD